MRHLLIALVLVLLPATTYSQQEVASQEVASPPALSEVERLKLQVAELAVQLSEVKRAYAQCEAGGAAWVNDRAAAEEYFSRLTKELEAARPGYRFDGATRTFVPVPK